MATDTKNAVPKNTVEDATRWLRVGVLTLTTLAPIISSIAEQLRKRAQVASEEAMKRSSGVLADNQEKLLTVSASLADALASLKDHPYSQELARRGGDLTDTLVEQSSRLSQLLAEHSSDLLERSSDVVSGLTERSGKTAQALLERSSEVVGDLADRSSKVTQVIAERSSDIVSDLADRSTRVTQEVTKRGQKVARQVTDSASERPGFFWSVFGFSMGLSAAIVALYILLRRRIQEESVESQSFQLAQNGGLNGNAASLPTSVKANASVSYPAAQPQASQPSVAVVEPAIAPESATPSPTLQQTPVVAQPVETTPAVAETAAPPQAERPLDATFLGIVSTKRYYPVDTKLDQIETPEGQPVDVVYFTSEEDAKEQGYSKAE